MVKYLRKLLLCLFFIGVLTGIKAQEADSLRKEAVVAFFNKIDKGSFEAARKMYSKEYQSKFDSTALKNVYLDFVKDAGAFISVDEFIIHQENGMYMCDTKANYEKKWIYYKVALNVKNQILGFIPTFQEEK